MSAATQTRRCVIEGHAFEIALEKPSSDWKVKVSSEEPEFIDLGHVIHTGFIYGAEKFLKAVKERQGQSFEGAVNYCYADEEPDDVTEGHVGLSFLDNNTEVTETLFRSLVVCAASVLRDAIEADGGAEPIWSELLDSIE